jgi:hypothetical protein
MHHYRLLTDWSIELTDLKRRVRERLKREYERIPTGSYRRLLAELEE